MELTQDKAKSQQVETLKVLIADDDAPTRMLLRAAISQWGYEIVEAKDGEQAWNILQESSAPRLLILDWLMPKLDGIVLCERVKRELSSSPYIYIILLTQLTGTTNIIKGLEAGADEFLSKPFNMAELRSRLSVGARIVKYENKLTRQNEQLHQYVSYLKELANDILNISQKVYQLNKFADTLNQTPEIAIHLQKIKELEVALDHVSNLIESIQKVQQDE